MLSFLYNSIILDLVLLQLLMILLENLLCFFIVI